jgi:ABC-type sugar transport system substrate-binding protein
MMAANPDCAEEPAALSKGKRPSFCGRESTGIWRSQAGRIPLVGSIALLTFCLAGSGWASDKKVVGATLLNLRSPFMHAVGEALKAEADLLGIELIPLDPARVVATELEQVKDLIARKVDLIIMVPVDQRTSQTAAKLVNQAGIPLLFLKTELADDFISGGGRIVAYVGSDDTLSGQIEGQYLADKLPQGGNVVYLVVKYGSSATELRKAGFESVIEDHPNLRIVDELQANALMSKGKTIMENLLKKYPKGQLQALVAQNDEMALGASSAIQAADRLGEFKVLIGIDGLKAGLDAVADGTLTATLFQDAIGQGTQAMIVASQFLAGEKVAPRLLFPFKLVTKENVASFR